MNFEPTKFLIGLIDFFSVLLPGALLAYLMADSIGPLMLGTTRYRALQGVEAGAVFLFASYLLGHFVFLMGAWLDETYDFIRKATDHEQIKRLARGEPLSSRLARWLAALFLKSEMDLAVTRAVQLKERYLDPLGASAAINAFQWSKARLALENREALATVQRFEADSKFFRSLMMVVLILIPLGIAAGRPAIALASVPIFALAFWRYVDQRAKATTQAYWFIITMEGNKGVPAGQPLLASAPASAEVPNRAGGVVFRRAGEPAQGRDEYLLVQAQKAPHEWVLPKGHIESGEQTTEAAVREVREETGVWARVIDDLGDTCFVVKAEQVRVRFFLMESLEQGAPIDGGRKHQWCTLPQALQQLAHQENRDLLKRAEDRRAARGVQALPQSP